MKNNPPLAWKNAARGAESLDPIERSDAGGFAAEVARAAGPAVNPQKGQMERDKIEMQTNDALTLNHAILAASPVGIATYRADGSCALANEAAARMVGGTVEELKAQNFREIPSWKASGLLVAAERVLRTGVPEAADVHLLTSFQKAVWLNCRFVAFQHREQLHLLALFADVSERKSAELEVERREKRFRCLIENASDLVTVVSFAGKILYKGPSEEKILGYAPEEMIGRSAYDFIHPEDKASTAEGLYTVAGNPVHPVSIEHRFRHRDGSWRTMQSIGRTIQWEDSVTAAVLNSRDITDGRKLEAEFRQAQKMEALGQLAGGVAHDFNNILMVINGYSEMVLHAPGIPPAEVELLKEIYAAGERAAELTRQLLAFSRKPVARVQSVNLNEILSDVLKMLGRLVGEHIRLNLQAHPKLPPILADSAMIEQVLMNLALNARDAMPEGGALSFSTSVAAFSEADARQVAEARPGPFVCLTVTDTGTGIPADILPQIFDPFFTTKPEGKGTGLGLSTVFGIIKQHRGWVAVETEIGRGTSFNIFLPAETDAPVAAAAARPTARAAGGHETILVVEDETVVRELAVIVLAKLGYRALEAANGDEALEVWERHGARIDLLLTDMVMPGSLTGRQLAEKLRRIKPSLKVIGSSGYDGGTAGQMFGLLEGAAFLQKPYPPRKLAEQVRACLDAK